MAYLTAAEVAERLKVYPGTVKRWLREGSLAGMQLGDRAGWRVSEEDLEAFIEQRRNVSTLPTQEEEKDAA
jgi:excisionase family DNA binding protein